MKKTLFRPLVLGSLMLLIGAALVLTGCPSRVDPPDERDPLTVEQFTVTGNFLQLLADVAAVNVTGPAGVAFAVRYGESTDLPATTGRFRISVQITDSGEFEMPSDGILVLDEYLHVIDRGYVIAAVESGSADIVAEFFELLGYDLGDPAPANTALRAAITAVMTGASPDFSDPDALAELVDAALVQIGLPSTWIAILGPELVEALVLNDSAVAISVTADALTVTIGVFTITRPIAAQAAYEVPYSGAIQWGIAGALGSTNFFYLDLNEFATRSAVFGGIPDIEPAGFTTANSVVLPFTANLQRFNFRLTDEQIAFLATAANVRFTITGSALPDANFRYHLGDPAADSNWNATNSFPGGVSDPFSQILDRDPWTFSGNRSPATLAYFILQTMENTAPSTVTIESIRVSVTQPGLARIDIDPPAYQIWDTDLEDAPHTINFSASIYPPNAATYGRTRTWAVVGPAGVTINSEGVLTIPQGTGRGTINVTMSYPPLPVTGSAVVNILGEGDPVVVITDPSPWAGDFTGGETIEIDISVFNTGLADGVVNFAQAIALEMANPHIVFSGTMAITDGSGDGTFTISIAPEAQPTDVIFMIITVGEASLRLPMTIAFGPAVFPAPLPRPAPQLPGVEWPVEDIVVGAAGTPVTLVRGDGPGGFPITVTGRGNDDWHGMDISVTDNILRHGDEIIVVGRVSQRWGQASMALRRNVAPWENLNAQLALPYSTFTLRYVIGPYIDFTSPATPPRVASFRIQTTPGNASDFMIDHIVINHAEAAVVQGWDIVFQTQLAAPRSSDLVELGNRVLAVRNRGTGANDHNNGLLFDLLRLRTAYTTYTGNDTVPDLVITGRAGAGFAPAHAMQTQGLTPNVDQPLGPDGEFTLTIPATAVVDVPSWFGGTFPGLCTQHAGMNWDFYIDSFMVGTMHIIELAETIFEMPEQPTSITPIAPVGHNFVQGTAAAQVFSSSVLPASAIGNIDWDVVGTLPAGVTFTSAPFGGRMVVTADADFIGSPITIRATLRSVAGPDFVQTATVSMVAGDHPRVLLSQHTLDIPAGESAFTAVTVENIGDDYNDESHAFAEIVTVSANISSYVTITGSIAIDDDGEGTGNLTVAVDENAPAVTGGTIVIEIGGVQATLTVNILPPAPPGNLGNLPATPATVDLTDIPPEQIVFNTAVAGDTVTIAPGPRVNLNGYSTAGNYLFAAHTFNGNFGTILTLTVPAGIPAGSFLMVAGRRHAVGNDGNISFGGTTIGQGQGTASNQFNHIGNWAVVLENVNPGANIDLTVNAWGGGAAETRLQNAGFVISVDQVVVRENVDPYAVQRDTLNTAITVAQRRVQQAHTEATWTPFSTALAYAVAGVAAGNGATLTALTTALTEAQGALARLPPSADWQAVIDSAFISPNSTIGGANAVTFTSVTNGIHVSDRGGNNNGVFLNIAAIREAAGGTPAIIITGYLATPGNMMVQGLAGGGWAQPSGVTAPHGAFTVTIPYATTFSPPLPWAAAAPYPWLTTADGISASEFIITGIQVGSTPIQDLN